MNDRAVIRGLIRQGAQINIIGDSLAAGAGSSDSYSTEEVILHDGDDVFVRRAAPNSWWAVFKTTFSKTLPRTRWSKADETVSGEVPCT